MAKKNQDKQNHQLDSSEVTSITDIAQKYKKSKDLLCEISELKQYIAAKELEFKKIKQELSDKDQEIDHLKLLLASTVPVVNKKESMEIQDEETIAEMQLHKLKNIAYDRDLTLEEARKFEIYSKVKREAMKNKPQSPKWRNIEEVPSQTLIEIASSQPSKNNE